MAQQSPTISIPKKGTDEVDWTSPIRTLISHTYGESPDSYASECAALQRCRQDAVRGAGSEMTARDLLYKYFGQLELLELRFSDIRVSFPWRDAFTSKLTTQTSLAYEKASIIFQIASTHSAIASSQNRSDPEGLKRSFYYFRAAAGMLTYINDNFLHAPSTDLSRDVVKFLVGVMIAQAHEVFFEKCRDEKSSAALISRVLAQTTTLYSSLVEEIKEFLGKKIFDHNWVILLGIKAKYFHSLSQYYRALADSAAGKHGDSLARLNIAEKYAKEAHTQTATSFAPYYVTNQSPTLPSDAGSSILEITKSHLALCTEKKAEAQRDNDFIYNAVLPPEGTLPMIEKAAVATPIPIQDVYGSPDVQKSIGPDLFSRLIPLSVHESASVYSEEKAKLVRGEVEKADNADTEYKADLESLGVKEGLGKYRAMAEGTATGGEVVVPSEVRNWQDDVRKAEADRSVETSFRELERLKENVREELDGISRDLDIESKDCEAGRLKYEHKWTQQPSAGVTKDFRQRIKSHQSSLEAAGASDRQAVNLWDAAKADVAILLDDEKLGEAFTGNGQRSDGQTGSLLDIDDGNGDVQERARIGGYIAEIEERIGRLNKISRERNETLKDLKEKVKSDDVSHLLLLNRRNSSVEPTLFATELEKFRPYQTRIEATIQYQQSALQEIAQYWKALKDLAGRAPGARQWEEREQRKMQGVKRFGRARELWKEVREGVAKGLQFYRDLSDIVAELRRNVKAFVSSRTTEREGIIAKEETEKRLSSPPQPPPLPSLESSMSSLRIHGPTSPASGTWNGASQIHQSQPQYTQPTSYGVPKNDPSSFLPPPLPHQHAQYNAPVATPSAPPPPPPPPPPQSNPNPYGDIFNAPGLSSQFSLNNSTTPNSQPQYASTSAPPPAGQPLYPPPQPRPQYSSPLYPPPPPPTRQSSYPPPPMPSQPPQQQQPQQHTASSMFPPPPPPLQYQTHQYGTTTQNSTQPQQQPYQGYTPAVPAQQPQYGRSQPPAGYGYQ